MLGFTLTSDKYVVERDSRTKQVYLKNKKGKIILGPYYANNDIFFFDDAVICETNMGYNKPSQFCVYHITDDEKVGSYVDCDNLRALDNGNLVLGISRGDNQVRNIIYNPKVGRVSSDYFDYVGDFSYSDDGKNYSAIARIDVNVGADFGDYKIHFWGHINGDGSFITPLYNSVTNNFVLVNSEHSFFQELEESRQIIRERKLERKKTIENLPKVEPYKLY